MPGTPSLEAIPGFVALSPAPAVVVLTAHDEDAFAREALAAGASAYVLKDAAEMNVVEAIRAAVAGRPYLDPAMGARFATASRPPAPAPDRPGRGARDRLHVRRATGSRGSRAAAGWASSTRRSTSRSTAASRSS